jgi:sugar phosphate permease
MSGSGVFRGWWLVGAGFVLQGLVTAAISYSYGVVLAPIGAEFGATRLQLMFGITASTLASGLTSPFLGVAMDRMPLRRLALAGALLLGGGFVLLSRAASMTQVVAVYLLCFAPALSLLGPLLVSTLLARWFTRRRGTAMGVAALGTSVCGLLVPPLLQLGIDEFGWRVALAIAGAAMFTLAFPAALLLADRPQDLGLAPDGEERVAAAVAQPAGADSGSTRAILAQPNFWYVALVLGVLFSVYSALMSNLVPHAVGQGHAPARAALLMSSIALCGMLGKLAFGVVADRIDLRRGLAAAIVLVIASLALLLVDGRYATLLAASALLGFAAGGMLPVWGALMAVLFGAANYGRVMGLMNPVMMPLVLAGSPFAGWSHDLTGAYTLAFGAFAGALALAITALGAVRMPLRA